jgi:hypothetical protein
VEFALSANSKPKSRRLFGRPLKTAFLDHIPGLEIARFKRWFKLGKKYRALQPVLPEKSLFYLEKTYRKVPNSFINLNFAIY